MALRVGSMCSGYEGIGMALQSVLDVEHAWFVEFDAAPSKVLAHHWPEVPNHGDLTATDWTQVEPVDIVTAGFPCQPFSHAGKRLGANDERHLWPHIAQAIGVLRPRLVLLENVRGLLSGQGEPDPEWVADLDARQKRWQVIVHRVIDPKIRKAHRRGQLDRIAQLEADAVRLTEQRRAAMATVRRARSRLVRAIGVVVRDLAHLGYDVRWYGLRAADVGAAHGRLRVFIFAVPADSKGDTWRLIDGNRRAASDADDSGRGEHGRAAARGLTLLPTPTSSDTNGAGAHGAGGADLRTAVSLLPTPVTNDMGEGKTVQAWDDWTGRMKAAHGNGNGHGRSLAIEAQRLLSTPVVTDSPHQWGQYADAITRWECVLGRSAPAPTETGPRGNLRLSPAFTEWLMGLPHGWVTNVPGLTRTNSLKMLGNGVVPQQCADALRAFLEDSREVEE